MTAEVKKRVKVEATGRMRPGMAQSLRVLRDVPSSIVSEYIQSLDVVDVARLIVAAARGGQDVKREWMGYVKRLDVSYGALREHLNWLTQQFRNVESVTLLYQTGVRADEIEAILRLPRLRAWTMQACSFLRDSTWAGLWSTLIARNIKTLRKIVFGGMPHLGHFEALREPWTQFMGLADYLVFNPDLVHLHVTCRASSRPAMPRSDVFWKAMEPALDASSHALRVLSLGLPASSVALQTLARHAPQLEDLSLSLHRDATNAEVNDWTETDLKRVAESMKHLRHLRLGTHAPYAVADWRMDESVFEVQHDTNAKEDRVHTEHLARQTAAGYTVFARPVWTQLGVWAPSLAHLLEQRLPATEELHVYLTRPQDPDEAFVPSADEWKALSTRFRRCLQIRENGSDVRTDETHARIDRTAASIELEWFTAREVYHWLSRFRDEVPAPRDIHVGALRDAWDVTAATAPWVAEHVMDLLARPGKLESVSISAFAFLPFHDTFETRHIAHKFALHAKDVQRFLEWSPALRKLDMPFYTAQLGNAWSLQAFQQARWPATLRELVLVVDSVSIPATPLLALRNMTRLLIKGLRKANATTPVADAIDRKALLTLTERNPDLEELQLVLPESGLTSTGTGTTSWVAPLRRCKTLALSSASRVLSTTEFLATIRACPILADMTWVMSNTAEVPAGAVMDNANWRSETDVLVEFVSHDSDERAVGLTSTSDRLVRTLTPVTRTKERWGHQDIRLSASRATDPDLAEQVREAMDQDALQPLLHSLASRSVEVQPTLTHLLLRRWREGEPR